VRSICGFVIGCMVCALFFWKGILRSFSRNNTHLPLILMLVCGVIGSIVAMCNIPYWQRPWYKRDSDDLGSLTPDEAAAVYNSASEDAGRRQWQADNET
jgi:hypothetical protein